MALHWILNGIPLQYSCLENSMDGGAWWAAVHGVAKSRTQLHFHFHFHALEKEMATQCSCLENPRDGGVWWAAIHGVAQSQTWLKQLSSSSDSSSSSSIFTSLSPLCVCVFSSSVCYTSYKDTCYWISGHLGSSRMISLSQDPNLIRSLKTPPLFFFSNKITCTLPQSRTWNFFLGDCHTADYRRGQE